MTQTETARNALARRQADAPTDTILSLIERQTPAIERALGSAIGAERFARIVTTEIKRNARLLECQPETVLGALMLCAQLDLEPGPLGWAYLVPYRDTESRTTVCTFILGYRGIVELAHRSGKAAGVRAALVYEGDAWEYRETERGPRFSHVPCKPSERGELRGGYCAWMERLGPRVLVPGFKWCWPEDFDAARKRSPAGRKNVGPWKDDLDAMRLKTCVRRAATLMPQSPGFAAGLEVDEGAARWDGSEVIADPERVEDVQATEGSES